MVITGTLINAGAVLVGGTIGSLIQSGLPERMTKIVFQGLGLFSIFLGITLALKTNNNYLIMSFAMIIGGLLGELFRIEDRIEGAGDALKAKLNTTDERFTEGLVTACMLFSIGSMAILGPLNEALNGDMTLVLTKSLMDGFSAIALAAAFGRGVIFAAIPVLVIQGGIGFSAQLLQPILKPGVIDEISAVGGLLILGIGISILEIKKIKVINLLPAIIIIVPLWYLWQYVGI